MEVINHTPFHCAYLAGRVNYPAHSLTLIVKGTFDCFMGESLQPAKEQLFPTGDVYLDDNIAGSCIYESDFAYYKPRADLLLTGKCHVPGSQPATVCKVVFQVGSISKMLAVFGKRHWKGLTHAPSEPELFTEMQLCYENSFGGAGFAKNPVGTGFTLGEAAGDPRSLLLPAIEDPRRLLYSPSDRPEPAGFGPLGKTWQQRGGMLGTYTERYVDERWPWFPVDFDWSYFNAAPRDMQVEGFLKGNEPLFFQNLHPQHSHYHCRLPGLRIRCFVNKSPSPQPEQCRLQEIPLNLDTLSVDMEAEKLVLVWRGVTAIEDEEFTEIQHLFLMSERLLDQPASVAECQEAFLQHFREEEEEFREETPDSEEDAGIEEKMRRVEEEIAAGEQKLRAELHAAGIDPDIESPPLSDEAKAEEARLMQQYLADSLETEPAPTLTRQEVESARDRCLDLCDKDLSNLDLSELKLQGMDLRRVVLAGAKLQHTDLTGCNLAEANLSGADLTGCLLQRADLHDADCTGALFRQADLSGAILEDAILEKAQMEQAILSGVMAKGCDFSETNLAHAVCSGGMFEGADFSRAGLGHADFRRANLKDASFEGVKASYASFDDADITQLRAAEGSSFSRATLRRTQGAGSIWTGADLTEVDFSFSDLAGADFSSATLRRAIMVAADLKKAKFVRAKMQEARCLSVNLFQGSLEKADLTDADFSGANLYGAEFLNAIVTRTKFQMANLKMTKLAKKNG